MQATVEGQFVKIVFKNELNFLLQRNSTERPPARYNRRGEDALYLSENEAGARVALRKYVNAADAARVIVTFAVSRCRVFDIRESSSVANTDRQNEDWREVLASGGSPRSWEIADHVRGEDYAGLLDPSRNDPTVCHLVLFNWNAPGAPSVKLVGDPQPISL